MLGKPPMRKIVITGPECSGKSVLSEKLAKHYGVLWVPEMARAYLDELGRPYREDDLLRIAQAQLKAEEDALNAMAHAPYLMHDTDLITIRIWGEEKYGRSDPWVVGQTVERPYDLWLLSKPDIPWVFDPQRENPHDRDRLFAVHERLLQELGKPYVVVGGDEEERLRQAVVAIEAARP
ncbi:MAG TPA: ATP-binding protein [Flavobacteriales bacterium]|nr:ATP-binding protein [Flavobacteriales bacterium]